MDLGTRIMIAVSGLTLIVLLMSPFILDKFSSRMEKRKERKN